MIKNNTILQFYKMHALGNDFIIIDNTANQVSLTPLQIKLLCDRKFGIGCDQLILSAEIKPKEVVRMSIFNSDGSSASACGNATRCVGLYFMNKYQTNHIKIKTENRTIPLIKNNNDNIITANMGPALFGAKDIPLASNDLAPEALNFSDIGLNTLGMAVNVGNPHVVFVVPDVNSIDLEKLGPIIENHPYFPNKTNVEFIEIKNPNTIRMRVWERGTGITLSCGTGATASFAAAAKQSLIASGKTTVILDGGKVLLYFDDKQNIIFEGSVDIVFEGKIEI